MLKPLTASDHVIVLSFDVTLTAVGLQEYHSRYP